MVVLRRCTFCLSKKSLSDVVQSPCGHDQCKECLVEFFTLTTKDEALFPAQYCGQVIPFGFARQYPGAASIHTAEEKSIEFEFSDRTYCSRAIASDHIDGERATCLACGSHTCTICKNNAHNIDCPEGTATQEILESGRGQGRQRRYSCRRLSGNIHGERTTFQACGTHTYTIRKNNAHNCDCPEDTATHEILENWRE